MKLLHQFKVGVTTKLDTRNDKTTELDKRMPIKTNGGNPILMTIQDN